MFSMRYIPGWVKSLCISLVIFSILSMIPFVIGTATGHVQANPRPWLGIPIVGVLSLSISIGIMCLSALIENVNRKRDGDTVFICLNRYGSALDNSFGFSQSLMSIGFCIGLGGTGAGIWFLVKILKLL